MNKDAPPDPRLGGASGGPGSGSGPGPAHELLLERVLDAPRQALWRCWTEPGLLKQWFCPKPWFVSEARIDLRPGGEFFSLMNGPDGEQFGNAGVFLEVVDGERIVFTDALQPGWLPAGRAFMVADVSFEDVGAGRTRYRARAMHWSAEALKEHEDMGFHDGWNQAADQLVELARSLETASGRKGATEMEPIIYLNFNGDCFEAMTHYAEVLGGTVGGVFRNGDAPDAGSRMPGGDDLVLNMAIRLGNTMMMASDCPEDGCPEAMYRPPAGFAVSIDPGSVEAFDRVYAGLAEGARAVHMAPAETFWAERFAMFVDRYGTPWMLNFSGSKMAECDSSHA